MVERNRENFYKSKIWFEQILLHGTFASSWNHEWQIRTKIKPTKMNNAKILGISVCTGVLVYMPQIRKVLCCSVPYGGKLWRWESLPNSLPICLWRNKIWWIINLSIAHAQIGQLLVYLTEQSRGNLTRGKVGGSVATCLIHQIFLAPKFPFVRYFFYEQNLYL